MQEARGRTDELFSLVRPEALYERPIPERHRLIFYLGHLEAFDWNLIGQYALSAPAFHADFDRLFAFGIDPDAEGLPQDQAKDWPAVQEVLAYNTRVRETLDPLTARSTGAPADVAIEHRLMHAETFAYLLHGLHYERKVGGPLPDQSRSSGGQKASSYVDVPPGTAVLGRPRHDGFGWDNEFQEYSVEVPAFRIGRYKVTNAEYLDFVRSGRTRSPFLGRSAPPAGSIDGMFGEVPLPPDAPVYVTQEQAAAYAQWAGGSLPTEPQWHRAAEGAPAAGNLDFRSGIRLRYTPPRKATAAGACAADRQRLGMDLQRFRAFPRLRALSVLSRLIRPTSSMAGTSC